MKFRTEIKIDTLSKTISHKQGILMMGSCFSDNIGACLKKYLFNIQVNPFGVTYNPASVEQGLRRILSKKAYSGQDLDYHNELWFSFDHYTKYSGTDKNKVLEQINLELKDSIKLLENAGHLILTFGTSFIYQKAKDGKTVSNCHKIPAAEFTRRQLTISEIVESYSRLISEIRTLNPEIQFIFTISPVRHLKDGFIQNQQSKAVLLLAVRELVQKYYDFAYYFPAYEIMMDDLRDYRYYGSDLLHPGEEGIRYIWEKFTEATMGQETQQIMQELEPVIKGLQHKALHPNTKVYESFRNSLNRKIEGMKSKYPYLNWNILIIE